MDLSLSFKSFQSSRYRCWIIYQRARKTLLTLLSEIATEGGNTNGYSWFGSGTCDMMTRLQQYLWMLCFWKNGSQLLSPFSLR